MHLTLLSVDILVIMVQILKYIFFFIQNVSDLADAVERRKTLYQKWGLTLQPCIFAELNFGSFYVCFDDFNYTFSTALRAIDVCFKLHQSLHLKYNFEATNTWLFIQRAIYNIETVYDRPSPGCHDLVNQYRILS